MKTGAPTVVSLFAGAGGLDIGLESAGFTTISANDFDADCVETLRESKAAGVQITGDSSRAYLEATEIVHGPIESLGAADLKPVSMGTAWRPDLLVGGPPCQPFSSAGKMRSVDDPRGRLFEHFVRIADEMQPKFILFENVRGLVTSRGPTGTPGEVIHLVKEAFEGIGYGTRFALLNSADFGSPQRRVRCFMIASRFGSPPLFPAPTHSANANHEELIGASPWRSLGDFLSEFPDPTASEILRPGPELAKKLNAVPDGSGLKSPGVKEATRPGGHWGYKQGTWVADKSMPSRTITGASSQDWIRDSNGNLRRLTWRECAGIQGFPSDWHFAGSVASKFRQIGNAVPVAFGEAIGGAMLNALTIEDEDASESAPFPETFSAAIAYTKREHARNGESRRAARTANARNQAKSDNQIPLSVV
jgi:DNA (cytosine-5)-methyltransferase 1